MDNQKTELAYKVEGAVKKWKVMNSKSEIRIKCKCKYRRTADHGNVQPVTIREPLDMLEEPGRGKRIDTNEKSGCDEKDKDV